MIKDTRAWPEGEMFTKSVEIPVQDDLVEVEVTYTVPPFETLVAIHENCDPEMAYPLFRQFIVDWDLQDKLTDYVLMGFLAQNIQVSEVIFSAWADHMKKHIAARQHNVMCAQPTIN